MQDIYSMYSKKIQLPRRSFLALAGAAVGSRFLPAFAEGTDTTLVPPSFTLFYKPERTGNIWDTWIYYHEGTFYLYYNPSPSKLKTIGGWNGVALATSRNGVHWKEHGMVLPAIEGITFLGSGAVWTAHDHSHGEKKFVMNFSETRQLPEGNSRQTLCVAESRDLIHWKRLAPQYELNVDPHRYDPNGRWDNLWPVPRREGGYYGYWAASPKNNKVGIGVGESLDGIKWRALEPALLPEVPLGPASTPSPEVGAVHLWRNKYYALVGLNGTQPIVEMVNDQLMFHPSETTAIADSPFGPFLLSRKNRRLLVGNASYFTRFVDMHDEVLVNHQSWEADPNKPLNVDPDRVWMAPLKKAQLDDEGTLRLMWWEQNNLAKSEQLQITAAKSSSDSKPALLETAFDPTRTSILEGVMPLPDSKNSAPVGLYLQGTAEAGTGTAYLVRANGAVDYGSMRIDGTRFEKEDTVDRDLSLKDSARFRLVRKGQMTEFYLNDYLMQCHCLPEQGTGRIGLIGSGRRFHALNAWYCA